MRTGSKGPASSQTTDDCLPFSPDFYAAQRPKRTFGSTDQEDCMQDSSVKQKVLPSLGCTVYSSYGRALALQTCGWPMLKGEIDALQEHQQEHGQNVHAGVTKKEQQHAQTIEKFGDSHSQEVHASAVSLQAQLHECMSAFSACGVHTFEATAGVAISPFVQDEVCGLEEDNRWCTGSSGNLNRESNKSQERLRSRDLKECKTDTPNGGPWGSGKHEQAAAIAIYSGDLQVR